jgi:hypothetical protein
VTYLVRYNGHPRLLRAGACTEEQPGRSDSPRTGGSGELDGPAAAGEASFDRGRIAEHGRLEARGELAVLLADESRRDMLGRVLAVGQEGGVTCILWALVRKRSEGVANHRTEGCAGREGRIEDANYRLPLCLSRQ